MKKKGENLATREDIDNLLDQVRAVTTTTKEIEARISNEVWDRQKRWELKRDTLIEAARKLGEVMTALGELHAAYFADRDAILKGEPGHIDIRIKKAEDWARVSTEFSGSTVLLVGMICGDELGRLLNGFASISRKIAIEITGGNPGAFVQAQQEYRAKLDAVTTAISEAFDTAKVN